MSLAGEQHGFARIKTADALHSPLHEPQGNLNLPLTEMSWDLSRNVFTNPVDLAEKPATRTSDCCRLTRCGFLDERIIDKALIDGGYVPIRRHALVFEK